MTHTPTTPYKEDLKKGNLKTIKDLKAPQEDGKDEHDCNLVISNHEASGNLGSNLDVCTSDRCADGVELKDETLVPFVDKAGLFDDV